ncbi:MAG TPA: hypothetical protein DCS89_06335 [Gammaproteobacteria bacterium]|nr:hypothetical protein [Gammaproteobacteria bacterium]HAT26612.1 hypothetical protein [Gammaproteobacteria bacterium]
MRPEFEKNASWIAAMTPMNYHPHMPIFICVFVLILSSQHAIADSVKILEWNISGRDRYRSFDVDLDTIRFQCVQESSL